MTAPASPAASAAWPQGAPLDTGSSGEKTFTVNATDNAGNPASKSVSYSVRDSSAPSIAFTNPTDGAVYTLGQKVVAGYSCADEPNGSGVATCEGTLPVGAKLDTSRVGAKTFTVRTSDRAGNADSRTVSYSVAYDFDGFLWPLVNPPRVNRWKAGLPVPVRFSLGSYRGSAPVAAGYPKVAPVSCGAGAQAGRLREGARLLEEALGARVQARRLDLHVPLEDREELGGRLPPVRSEARRRHAPSRGRPVRGSRSRPRLGPRLGRRQGRRSLGANALAPRSETH